MENSAYLWRPADHAWTSDSHLARFMRTRGVASVAELRQASVHCYQWFWDEVLRDMGIEWTQRYTQMRDTSRGFAWTRWFIGGEINVTHNCIDRHVRDGHGADTALFVESETGVRGETRAVTFAELEDLVNRCALALRGEGVQRGDRVAVYAPMQVPTVVVMFATMKLGAQFVPIFSGYGETALRDRLANAEVKVLFACTHVTRRGRTTETQLLAQAAAAAVPSVTRVVWTDTADWETFLLSGGCIVPARERLVLPMRSAFPAEVTTAEDPCLILYTSGTTGAAKATVHTHAGCLAQMGKELRYAFDVRPGEPFCWVTDIGWMMGPWELIGCLLYRTPVVLLDGAPDFPTSDRLWELCARIGVVTLGCSPTAVRKLMRATDGRGPQTHDLGRLRVLGSTGEVWDEASYRWYFDRVGGSRCPVINISGGTELVGCLLQPYPVEPLKACSVGGPALGMDVDIFSDDGKPVAAGDTGHLVCKQPAPSMTKSFLNDDARYLETYFSRFPGTWCHGDWVQRDRDGAWFVLGRTDDTLKIAGQRIGPGEIEGALMSHAAVAEAAVIGVPDEIKGMAAVAFVVPRPERAGSAFGALETELIAHVAQQLGKPLAPKAVWPVDALPKTRSGKIVRAQLARVFLGQSAGDISALENPAALTAIGRIGQPQPA